MNGLGPQEVRDQLERILTSGGFRDAGRLGPFLKFAVEAAMAGDSGKLKESVLGVEVFERAPDFDPRTDPIVRVEARRLRSRLDEYYQAHPADPVLITLPKGGYVPVFDRTVRVEPTPASPPKSGPRVAGWLIVVALLSMVGAGLTWLYLARQRALRQPTPAVVVLPFQNLSADPANQYFSDGLTIELIDALSKIDTLRVVSWGTVSRLRGKPADMAELKRELQAGAVMDGSVRKEGDRIRVTAQLTDTTTGDMIWSQTYAKESKDIFAIQEEVAKAIVYGLKVQLRVDPQRVLVPVSTGSTAALENYLRARTERNNFSPEGLFRSNQYAEKAIEVDPKYSPAYALIASNYTLLGYFGGLPPASAFAKGREVATQAIAMDSNSGEARAALAGAMALGEWKWQDAEAEFLKAVRASPGSADVHSGFAMTCLLPQGKLEAAEYELRKALEIDPYSFVANFSAGYALLQRGKLDESIEQYQKALRIFSGFADLHWDFGMALAFAGRKDEAREAFRAADRTRGRPNWSPDAVESALLGDRQRAIELAPRVKDNCLEATRAYALAGEKENALTELEKALGRRETQIVFVKVDKRLESLHGHPRFEAVLTKLGLKKAD